MSLSDSEFFAPTPRPPESLIEVDQDAAIELVYGILGRTCIKPSVFQPTFEDGVQTIELVPRDIRWDSLGLIAYPAPAEPRANGPEPIVCVQLSHGTDTSLELVHEYLMHFYEKRYWAAHTPLLHDTVANTLDPMNGPRALNASEMNRLNQWIYELPARQIAI